MNDQMTQEEAGAILGSALDVVRKDIETREGGDRPISPPVWMLQLETKLIRAKDQIDDPGALERNLWGLESLRDLIQDMPEHRTPRNIQTVFTSWRSGGA